MRHQQNKLMLFKLKTRPPPQQQQQLKQQQHIAKGVNRPAGKCPEQKQRSHKEALSLWKAFKSRRRLVTIIIYSWLFMNIDPAYMQMARRSLQAASLFRRSLGLATQPINLFGARKETSREGSLNAVEAIALIHAINSNNHNKGAHSGDLGDLSALLGAQQATATSAQRQSLFNRHTPNPLATTSLMQRQQSGLDRQLPVPLPVPVPLPTPLPTPTPLAPVAAALAAFAAAALAGFTPLAALAAALAAFAAAALLALLALLALVPAKTAPIVKKLVIKKTVLPFVIPIPFKKKEKEIVYKYIPKPVHVHHHEHEKKKKSKYYYSMKKSDTNHLNDDDETQSMGRGHLDKIQNLLSEQDRIQMMVDDLVKPPPTQAEAADLDDFGRRSGMTSMVNGTLAAQPGLTLSRNA